MNIFFLVEGEHTETKVYPKWLTYLLPMFKRVYSAPNATKNNYYLISGKGYERLLGTVLDKTIEELIQTNNFDYLVICVDADNRTVEETKNIIQTIIKEIPLQLPSRTELKIIVQNKCIETWFLGNRQIWKRNPQSKQLRDYIEFYNIYELNPEDMERINDSHTVSDFHYRYLKEILQERGISYTKKSPNHVIEKHYLDELINRQEETNHLQSFKTFIDFCQTVQQQMQTTDQD